jgi:CelD/BcsL family acetyltransferase involved in cellulose biosynthesis
MHVRLLTTTAQLAALQPQWQALDGGVPFRSWQWLAAWWEEQGAGRGGELYTLACFEGDILIAVAPWYRQRTPLGRVVRALGDGAVCTDYLGIPCAPGRELAAAAALAAHLSTASAAAGWELLRLEAQDPSDETLTALCALLGARDHAVTERPGPRCWRIALPVSMDPAASEPLSAADVRLRWDAYLATLSRSHRSQTRRLERRSCTARLHVVRTAAEFPAAFDILVLLHQRRRNQLGDPGLFASPSVLRFHRAAAERLLHSGHLWLAWLEFAGRPVAAQYGARAGSTLYVYQSGVEPTMLDLEPGRMMLILALRYALAHGIRSFDLLRGDEPYKGHFRATPHPLRDLLIADHHLSGRLGYHALTKGRRLRTWAREFRGFLRDRLRPSAQEP